MNNNLHRIRRECIAANQEIEVTKVSDGCRLHGGGWLACSCTMQERPIRLADVLLAIPHLKPPDHRNIVRGQAESSGNMGFINVVCEWNLRKDDLSEQSEETINFINELLK